MAKVTRTSDTANANWVKNTKGAVDLYKSQVLLANWKQYAASDQAEKNYNTSMTEVLSKKKRQGGVNSSSDEVWRANTSGVGADHLATGVEAAKTKQKAAMDKIIPAINAAKATLKPRGVAGSPENKDRANAFTDAMHAKKGTLKAGSVAKS